MKNLKKGGKQWNILKSPEPRFFHPNEKNWKNNENSYQILNYFTALKTPNTSFIEYKTELLA